MSVSEDQLSKSQAGPNIEGDPGQWTTMDALDQYRSRGQTHPFAVVIWWTDRTAAIACPYCQRVHKHGCSPPLRHDLTSRASHCQNSAELSLQYTLLFPFSEHPEAARLHLCFEIDKINIRFKTIGVDAKETTDESIDDVENAFWELVIADNENEDDEDAEDKVKAGEANERVKVTKKIMQRSILLDDNKDAIDFVSFCVSNELRRARSVYEQSPHQSQLLNDKDSAGDTILSLTAMNGHAEVVTFLLEKGAEVDTVNAKGRTPLMEAALWGHSLVVSQLLRAAASIQHRDYRGHTALGLAKDSRQNEEERASRSFMYSDDLDKQKHRRFIVVLLQGTHSLPHEVSGITIDNAESACIRHSPIDPQSSKYALLISSIEIPVENCRKTVALLIRCGSFPVACAKNGRSKTIQGVNFLNGSYWTNEVLNLCATVDHDLPLDDLDGDQPGRFHACHAGKQLMAFFVHKHRISKRERDGDKGLAELAKVHFPVNLPHVQIIASTPMCEDCEVFRAKLQRHSGVSIKVTIPYCATVA